MTASKLLDKLPERLKSTLPAALIDKVHIPPPHIAVCFLFVFCLFCFVFFLFFSNIYLCWIHICFLHGRLSHTQSYQAHLLNIDLNDWKSEEKVKQFRRFYEFWRINYIQHCSGLPSKNNKRGKVGRLFLMRGTPKGVFSCCTPIELCFCLNLPLFPSL